MSLSEILLLLDNNLIFLPQLLIIHSLHSSFILQSLWYSILVSSFYLFSCYELIYPLASWFLLFIVSLSFNYLWESTRNFGEHKLDLDVINICRCTWMHQWCSLNWVTICWGLWKLLFRVKVDYAPIGNASV